MTNQSTDFMGNVVDIGDVVIFMELRYRNFLKGKIVGITPHKFRIEFGERNKTILQAHHQVIKVDL
jgi:hypothetical protein